MELSKAYFELKSNSCDGHIRALSKAIQVASKISTEGLLEFTSDKMRLCARTEIFLVKFIFYKDFFTEYNFENRHRCFVNLKALMRPFSPSVLMAEKEGTLRSTIRITCSVEDEINNQLKFRVEGAKPTALIYRLSINDLDPERMNELNAINRTIDYKRVEIAPKQSKRERFLLSAFNNFAPDIDQVTIKTSQSEVKFIGSTSPLCPSRSTFTTSEFTHKREDFQTFTVNEDLKITVPLRYLKMFLNFVETNKIQTLPKYTFEGVGLPAHFVYDAQLFKAHFVSSTQFEYFPDELCEDVILPITVGPNESFIADENVFPLEADEECDDDGYNDNLSDLSENLDGNLDGLNPATNYSGLISLYGNESIRSEIKKEVIYDPEKIREILDLDVDDVSAIENPEVCYSSDED